MRATFQNAGMVAVDRHLLQPDDRRAWPPTLPTTHARAASTRRGRAAGVAAAGRRRAAGRQPVRRVPRLQPDGDACSASTGSTACPRPTPTEITGKTFFPDLISKPFIDGLRIAFSFSFLLFLVAAWVSWRMGAPRASPEPTEVSEALEEVALS